MKPTTASTPTHMTSTLVVPETAVLPPPDRTLFAAGTAGARQSAAALSLEGAGRVVTLVRLAAAYDAMERSRLWEASVSLHHAVESAQATYASPRVVQAVRNLRRTVQDVLDQDPFQREARTMDLTVWRKHYLRTVSLAERSRLLAPRPSRPSGQSGMMARVTTMVRRLLTLADH